MIWFYSLFKIRNIIKNPYFRIILFSTLGFLILYLISFNFGSKKIINWTIQSLSLSISGVWFILTYSQIHIQLDSVLLKKNRRFLIIILHIFSMFVGVMIYLLQKTDDDYRSFLFVSLFLITRNVWFVLNQLLELIIDRKWPAFNILGVSPNLILTITFRMTFHTKLLNNLSNVVWKKKTKYFLWCFLIFATILEITYFFLSKEGTYTFIFLDDAKFSTYILISLFMSVFHEWGHLIAAKMYSGFGFYISKLNSLVSNDAVQIPLLLFTPKERIKIAIMGTLWCNLVILLPTAFSILAKLAPDVFSPILEEIFLTMVFYAVLSSMFFFSSIWSGGDMNNIIRDLYLIISGKNEIPKHVFNSETEVKYSDEENDFNFIETQNYSFPKHIILKPVNENSFYFLDEKKQIAFFINDVAHEITNILLKLNYWVFDDILKQLKTIFDFEEDETDKIKADVHEFLQYLGKREYLTINDALLS